MLALEWALAPGLEEILGLGMAYRWVRVLV